MVAKIEFDLPMPGPAGETCATCVFSRGAQAPQYPRTCGVDADVDAWTQVLGSQRACEQWSPRPEISPFRFGSTPPEDVGTVLLLLRAEREG